MSASKDLIPLPTVKKWSKTLSKIWVEAGGNQKPTLSVSQEAIARILGYKNWQELSISYHEQGTKHDHSLIKKEEPVVTPRIPLIGETDWNNKNSFVEYWETVFASLVAQQLRGVLIELSEEEGRLSVKHKDGTSHFVEHVDRTTTVDLLRVLYNVLAVNTDVTFDESSPQQAYLQGTYQQQKCIVFFKSRPFGLHETKFEIDLLSFEEEMVPLPLLTEINHTFQAISSPDLAVRTWLVSHLVRNLLHKGKRVVVVSDTALLVASNTNLMTTPVIHRATDSLDQSKERAVVSGRRLLDEENFDVFVVNTTLSASLLKKISLPIDKSVYITVHETHAAELRRNLEQQHCNLHQGRFIRMYKEFLPPSSISMF